MKSYPLEKIRLATPDEMLGSNYIVQMLEDMSTEIKDGKLMVEMGERKAPVQKRAEPSKGEEDEVDQLFRQLDEEEAGELKKRMRRMDALNDVPARYPRAVTVSGFFIYEHSGVQGVDTFVDFNF